MSNDDEALARLVKNFEKFSTFCGKLGERSGPALELVNHFQDRLVTCPASSRSEYHNAVPGGLVDHSLRVLSLTLKLAKTYEFSFPQDSIIIATLFHDIGKLGGLTEEYYLPETSSWHLERGKKYTHNPKLQYMTTAHRSLFLLQHFGLRLTEDEFTAILLNDGPEADENKPYSMRECKLAIVVHQADRMACEFEKNKS